MKSGFGFAAQKIINMNQTLTADVMQVRAGIKPGITDDRFQAFQIQFFLLEDNNKKHNRDTLK